MNEMGRQIKVPATKLKDWSLTPGTHGRGKNEIPEAIL